MVLLPEEFLCPLVCWMLWHFYWIEPSASEQYLNGIAKLNLQYDLQGSHPDNLDHEEMRYKSWVLHWFCAETTGWKATCWCLDLKQIQECLLCCVDILLVQRGSAHTVLYFFHKPKAHGSRNAWGFWWCPTQVFTQFGVLILCWCAQNPGVASVNFNMRACSLTSLLTVIVCAMQPMLSQSFRSLQAAKLYKVPKGAEGSADGGKALFSLLNVSAAKVTPNPWVPLHDKDVVHFRIIHTDGRFQMQRWNSNWEIRM